MEAANDGFHFFAYQVIAQITDGAFMGMMLDPVVMLSGRRRVSTDKLHSRRQQKSGKAVVALFRIYQRIMEEKRKICGECQVTKKKKRTREKKR